jgi:bacteriochlorophyllide a dehydrogenase
MSRSFRAVVFPAPESVEIRTLALPACEPDQLIAQTLYSFVSPGTELRVLGGTWESRDRFPLIPGYAWVGRVIEVGSELAGWDVGDLVSGRNPCPVEGVTQLWGGQASHHRCRVSGSDAVLKLPDGARPWDYITAEVAAISWRGVSMTQPAAGEMAVVVGQGMIGAMAARWLMNLGARVVAIDRVVSRLERARGWGATVIDATESDPELQFRALAEDGADIVIEATGQIEGAALAAKLLRQPAPRRTNTGYPASRDAGRINWPRISFLSTYTQRTLLPPAGLVRVEGALVFQSCDRTCDDRRRVIEQIQQHRFCTSDWLDEPTPVDQALQAYQQLGQQQRSAVAFAW